MLKAYIVELANYNGKWLSLPLEDDELSNEIKSLGNVGGDHDVHDFESDVEGLHNELGRLSIFQMNYLAKRLDELESHELETFEIVFDSSGDLEETFQRLEDHDFIILNDIDDLEDLGRAFVDEGLAGFTIPDNIANYFDYEAYGRDLSFSGWHIAEANRAAVCLD